MSDTAKNLRSDDTKFTIRIHIDSDMGDLLGHLNSKHRRNREAIHLMRLGLMCLEGKLPANGVQTWGGTVVATAKAGVSKTSSPALAVCTAAEMQEVRTGDGLQHLRCLPDDFFAGPPR